MDDDFQVQIASVTCQSFAGLRMEGLVGRTSGLQQEHSPESWVIDLHSKPLIAFWNSLLKLLPNDRQEVMA